MKFLKTFIVFAMLLAIPALAMHTSDVTVSPQLYGASKETTVWINVTNEGKDNVNEMRVRVPVEFSALKCAAAPQGWGLAYSDSLECNYKTVANYIAPGKSLLFAINVTTAAKDGNYTWEVRTRDVVDDFSRHNPVTTVDSTSPKIKADTLEVPNGGEKWETGSQRNILWHFRDINDTNLMEKPVTLEYTADGKTWKAVATNLENSGAYQLTVPDTPTEKARVRITVSDKAGNTASDESDAPFTIVEAAPTVTLKVDESKNVDANNDGKNDTRITLKSVSADSAVLVVAAIPVPVVTPVATPTPPKANVTNITATPAATPVERGITSNPTVTAIIVILILIILYLIWRLNQLEKKKK